MAIAEHSTEPISGNVDFPNDPSGYFPTKHFLDMKKWRNIAGYIIKDVLSNGKLEKAKGDCWKFVKKVDGFTWWFIVEDHPGKEQKLKTAYVPEFEDDKELYDIHY